MQKPNPRSKSDCDNKMNAQMNEEVTSPNNEAPPTGAPMDIGTPPSTRTPMNRGVTPPSGMPMNGGMIPPVRMPMNGGMTPPTGRPMNGGMIPPVRMPMNGGMITPTGRPFPSGMPMNGTTPPAGIPPMDGSVPPGAMPPHTGRPPNGGMMGVPLYPLYGYDNCEDLDKDMDYLKQLYPNTAKRIQKEIDNECDKLEYDGSVMFDEYPDKVTLDQMIDRVYDKVKDMDENTQVEIKGLYRAPRRRQNLVRDIVSIVLLNEILNRRRRYRSRKRWF